MFHVTTVKDDSSETYLHEILKTETKRIKCKLCEKTFNILPSFNLHVKKKHSHKHLCRVCYRVHDSEKEQKSHEKNFHSKQFPCNHCNKKCWDYFGLKQHIRCIHPGKKPPPASNFNSVSGTPAADTATAVSSTTTTTTLATIPIETFHHEQPSSSRRNYAQKKHDKDEQPSSSRRNYAQKKHDKDEQPSSSRRNHAQKKHDKAEFIQFIHEYIDEKVLKCKLCGDIFNSNKEFNKHAKVQHEMKYLCFNCSEVFQDKKLRGRHINKYHTKYCDFCDKIFNVEASLEKHIQEVHFNSQNESIKYTEVPRLYSEDIFKVEDFDDLDKDDELREVNHEEDAFFLHETFQDKSGATIMKCKECEKTFRSYTRLRYHAKEKHQYEWLCLVCCQVFPSGRYRGIHMKQNHIKDFSCTLCSKKCYDVTGLREHFRAKHRDEKFPRILPQTASVQVESCQSPSKKTPRQFKCKYCSQMFSQKKLKKEHVKQNHVYTCQVCGRKLHTEKGLINHCKAKKHQMDNDSQEEKIIYPAILQLPQSREVQFSSSQEPISAQEGSSRSKKREEPKYLHDYKNLDSDDSSDDDVKECVKNDNMKEKQNVQEDDDEADDSEDNNSFNDDDDTEEENDESDDDRIRFPKCEECQLYFRDIKYLEIHNKIVHEYGDRID